MVKPEHKDNLNYLNYQHDQVKAPLCKILNYFVSLFLSIGQIFTSGLYVNSEYSSLYKEPSEKGELSIIQSVFFMY